MVQVTFLILHYKTDLDTVKCIQSINQCNYPNKTIVVVDNGSNDGSIEKVENIYPASEQIHYIKSDSNLGFAKGNNLGFVYAKETLHTDFIVMINSDIVILENDFCEQIVAEYQKSYYHVLGCDIRRNDGSSSNPIGPEFHSLKELEAVIRKRKRQLMVCIVGLEPFAVIWKKVLYRFSNRKIEQDGNKIGVLKKYQLHGSCLVFGKEYIQQYDGLIPITFLYEEEAVLRYLCDRDNLRMIYAPVTTVLHNEQRATKNRLKSLRQRRMFFYKNSLKSLYALRKMILESDNIIWKC